MAVTRKAALWAALASVSLAGCAADGRPRLISKNGEPLISRTAAANGLYSQFQAAAQAAYPVDLDSPPPAAVQRRYLRSGVFLVRTACNAYIEGKTDRQRSINVWRDLFAPITALAAGLIALDNSGDDVDSDYLAALGLVTTGATAGFKIYEQRFLFGAENVDNVRKLVLDAQLAHANEALATPDAQLDYAQATVLLLENQMICSPGSILELVSKAIEAGQVEAVPREAEVSGVEEEEGAEPEAAEPEADEGATGEEAAEEEAAGEEAAEEAAAEGETVVEPAQPGSIRGLKSIGVRVRE